METLAQLGRRVSAAEELEVVTRMMKAMAAVGLRRFEEGMRTLDEYEQIVESGLQVALRGRRGREVTVGAVHRDAPFGLVVFGGDLGLCGPVNRDVAAAARRVVDRRRPAAVVAVGGRLADELAIVDAGRVEQVIELPSTIEGVAARVDDVLVWIDRHVVRGIDRIEVIVPELPDRRERRSGDERDSAGTTGPVSRWPVVPADGDRLREIAARPWPTNQLPMHRASWPRVVSALTREMLVVRLHRAFVQTMMVVASSRLVAMDTAQRNIAERLDELHARHRALRQSEITAELLDVVAGFETLIEGGR
jgi:F-type H+-transporting ATPase subunit gamma